MKKTVWKAVTFAIVFFVSAIMISTTMNKGNTDVTVELAPSTLPLVYMNVGGSEVNCLHGYTGEMEEAYLRDTVTPIGEDRSLSVRIAKYGTDITGLSFEVRSVDGERLVEATDVYNYIDDGDSVTATFTIKDLIEDNTEHMLVLLVKNGDGQTLRYYTRIIRTDDSHADEQLAFVKDFHERTFDKEAAKEITKYLESNKEGDNSTYHKVDIHSSFQQITWGNLNVKKVTEPVIQIRELGSQITSMQLSYIVSVPEGKNINYYSVEEFYRVRYTPDRLYLLNYERFMDQYLNEENDIFVNDKILFGIADSDIQMLESDDSNVVAFVNENKLYSYNISDNKFSVIFGFYDAVTKDIRDVYDENGIKILQVDETGNVQFFVHGYMNRGDHEGEVGIQVYEYNSVINTIEEIIFIPYTKSPAILAQDIEELAYVNKSEILYLMLNGTVYAIGLEDKSVTVIVSNLSDDSFKVSASNSTIVWQTGESPYNSEALTVMNLNSKSRKTIEAGAGKYIAPLGFMGEDLIYGTVYKEDAMKNESGSMIFPMHEIVIQNDRGEKLKTYKQEGIYVTGCEVEDNQITLKRVEKQIVEPVFDRAEEQMPEQAVYVPIEDDQIMNNEEISVGKNTIITVPTEEFETYVQIALKKEINTKTLKIMYPKLVLYEGERKITLKNEEEHIERYYIYDRSGLRDIVTKADTAVKAAEEISGVVVNDKGRYVWAAGNRSIKNQIMAIKEDSATEEKSSLAVCLDTILKFEGIARGTQTMLSRGETAISILSKELPDAQIIDLSGCSLSSVLYYTNRDIPVLALLNDGNAVLLIGFNELNTVLMDPMTGTIYKKGMNDSTRMFEENGNKFITYVK